MRIKLRLACGHTADWEDGTPPPVCDCGERRIASVPSVRPRFRGLCEGPYATREELDAIPVPMPTVEPTA